MGLSKTAYSHMYGGTLKQVISDFTVQIEDYQSVEEEGMKLDKTDKLNLQTLIKERDIALEIYNSAF